MHIDLSSGMAVGGASLAEGSVVSAEPDGVYVSLGDDAAGPVLCRSLHMRGAPALQFICGDSVLVWLRGDLATSPVILGRISRGPDREAADGQADELVIEARKSLTLRVGDGSITIREDGRILIKGKELVSHAKGMNRIRGGSVAVN